MNEKMRNMKDEINSVLSIQIQNKRRLKDDERNEDRKAGKRLDQQAEEYRNEQRARYFKEEDKKLKYKRELDLQLTQKFLNQSKPAEDPYKNRKSFAKLENLLDEKEIEDSDV